MPAESLCLPVMTCYTHVCCYDNAVILQAPLLLGLHRSIALKAEIVIFPDSSARVLVDNNTITNRDITYSKSM
jgi:hypothetical protein